MTAVADAKCKPKRYRGNRQIKKKHSPYGANVFRGGMWWGTPKKMSYYRRQLPADIKTAKTIN